MKQAYIAVDFGGGSGRVIAASLSRNSLTLDELHRFENRQINMGGHIYWDFLSLFEEMKTGLRKGVEKGYKLLSVGIDTWGVDFGLIDRRGNLLGNPVCYRDPSLQGGLQRYFATEDADAHYSQSGIQQMDINSLYRLVDMRKTSPELLDVAAHLLFMPDLFSYFLTGEACNEYTIASTSELIDVRTRSWNRELIARVGLPEHLFGRIVMPGEVRGKLTDDIKQEIGIDYDVNVIAVGSHDTASAVHSVCGTYETDGTVFLSSGTWSLLGAVISNPVLTPQARIAGFTNEGATGGKIKFLQNITGLWILQRLIAVWKAAGLKTDYDFLLSEADKSGYSHVIDVDDPLFATAREMEKAIKTYCKAHNLPEPETQGDIVKCVLLSLATRYKRGVDDLASMLGKEVKRIQVIGGGSRNKLLNRLTEQVTGVPVEPGAVEATAIGNILLQAEAAGQCVTMAEINEIVCK